MKIKKDVEDYTSDPLFESMRDGYFDPHETCESKDDAERVSAAFIIMKDYCDSCEKHMEEFDGN